MFYNYVFKISFQTKAVKAQARHERYLKDKSAKTDSNKELYEVILEQMEQDDLAQEEMEEEAKDGKGKKEEEWERTLDNYKKINSLLVNSNCVFGHLPWSAISY